MIKTERQRGEHYAQNVATEWPDRAFYGLAARGPSALRPGLAPPEACAATYAGPGAPGFALCMFFTSCWFLACSCSSFLRLTAGSGCEREGGNGSAE